MITAAILSLAAAAAAGPAERPQTVRPTLVAEGAASLVGEPAWRTLKLALEPPRTLRRAPDGLEAPLYGVLPMATGDRRVFHVVLDEPLGQASRLYVDTDGDGDLQDDPEATWTWRMEEAEDGSERPTASGVARINLSNRSVRPDEVAILVHRFDPKDPESRDRLKLHYASDYALRGAVTLGGRERGFVIADHGVVGDFRGREKASDSGVALHMDADADGVLDPATERFDIRKPFTIGGKTYQVMRLDRLGRSMTFTESRQGPRDRDARRPARPKPQQKHPVGATATSFNAVTIDNRRVNFPADFKGRIVMIDFWATWCRPCMLEIPGLVAVHKKYRDQGFEVLGVSLDSAGSYPKIPAVMEEHGMTWPQICDKQGWNAAVAKLYGVRSIPHCLLVDGDTGEVLATSGQLRGARLEGTVKKALSERN